MSRRTVQFRKQVRSAQMIYAQKDGSERKIYSKRTVAEAAESVLGGWRRKPMKSEKRARLLACLK